MHRRMHACWHQAVHSRRTPSAELRPAVEAGCDNSVRDAGLELHVKRHSGLLGTHLIEPVRGTEHSRTVRVAPDPGAYPPYPYFPRGPVDGAGVDGVVGMAIRGTFPPPRRSPATRSRSCERRQRDRKRYGILPSERDRFLHGLPFRRRGRERPQISCAVLHMGSAERVGRSDRMAPWASPTSALLLQSTGPDGDD